MNVDMPQLTNFFLNKKPLRMQANALANECMCKLHISSFLMGSWNRGVLTLLILKRISRLQQLKLSPSRYHQHQIISFPGNDRK